MHQKIFNVLEPLARQSVIGIVRPQDVGKPTFVRCWKKQHLSRDLEIQRCQHYHLHKYAICIRKKLGDKFASKADLNTFKNTSGQN